jgi:branched-chain amino acid aminotransferase
MSDCAGNFFFFNNILKHANEFADALLTKGKSIYEVIRVKQGIPLFFEKHIQRLQNTAELENVNLFYNEDEILNKIKELVKINNFIEESVKIVFSYENNFFGEPQNIFLTYVMQNITPSKEQYEKGVIVISCQAERKNPNSKVINIKQRNELNGIASKKMVYETILINRKGNLTEGSRSNIFFIRNGVVFTTNVKMVLPGITRNNIIEICKENSIEIIENTIPFIDSKKFDCMFITGTSRKILPVQSLDNIDFDVNNLMMRKIMSLYDEKILNYISCNLNQH